MSSSRLISGAETPLMPRTPPSGEATTPSPSTATVAAALRQVTRGRGGGRAPEARVEGPALTRPTGPRVGYLTSRVNWRACPCAVEARLASAITRVSARTPAPTR